MRSARAAAPRSCDCASEVALLVRQSPLRMLRPRSHPTDNSRGAPLTMAPPRHRQRRWQRQLRSRIGARQGAHRGALTAGSTHGWLWRWMYWMQPWFATQSETLLSASLPVVARAAARSLRSPTQTRRDSSLQAPACDAAVAGVVAPVAAAAAAAAAIAATSWPTAPTSALLSHGTRRWQLGAAAGREHERCEDHSCDCRSSHKSAPPHHTSAAGCQGVLGGCGT